MPHACFLFYTKLWVDVLLHYDIRGHQTHSGPNQFSCYSSADYCEEKIKTKGWGVSESGWTEEQIVINEPESATTAQSTNHSPRLSTSSLALYLIVPGIKMRKVRGWSRTTCNCQYLWGEEWFRLTLSLKNAGNRRKPRWDSKLETTMFKLDQY